MLCVVIVPWDTIMIEKSEKLSLIFSKSVLRLLRQLRCVFASKEALVKSRHIYTMLLQKVSLQTMLVDGLDYGLQ